MERWGPKMTNNKIKRKVQAALDFDNTLVADSGQLAENPGFSTAYMAEAGLTKYDLNFLVSRGLAIRGLSRVVKGNLFKGSNIEPRWILLTGAKE